LGSQERCLDFLSDWQVDFVPSSPESAILAGANFARHLSRGGKKGRIVADFLIGAHAQLHADRLIARDRGYLRDYFEELTVLDPSEAPST
jgi:predicted nucleic acid-binding protein